MLDTIQAKRDDLYAVAKKHKAENLWVFGSCARKEETSDSDVDLLVQFSSGASLFDQGGLSHSIWQILGRGVDIVDLRGFSIW